jgi:hypothetical protein
VLDMSKIEAGRMELSPVTFSDVGMNPRGPLPCGEGLAPHRGIH